MTDKDLTHWADGSNTEPVRDGVREISQDPGLFDDDQPQHDEEAEDFA